VFGGLRPSRRATVGQEGAAPGAGERPTRRAAPSGLGPRGGRATYPTRGPAATIPGDMLSSNRLKFCTNIAASFCAWAS
jgi:hypothetical protein